MLEYQQREIEEANQQQNNQSSSQSSLHNGQQNSPDLNPSSEQDESNIPNSASHASLPSETDFYAGLTDPSLALL